MSNFPQKVLRFMNTISLFFFHLNRIKKLNPHILNQFLSQIAAASFPFCPIKKNQRIIIYKLF